MCYFMLGYLFCCWHTRVSYSMCPLCLSALSFEFHLGIICDVTTILLLFIMFYLFRILIEGTETIIMNGICILVDLIGP